MGVRLGKGWGEKQSAFMYLYVFPCIAMFLEIVMYSLGYQSQMGWATFGDRLVFNYFWL